MRKSLVGEWWSWEFTRACGCMKGEEVGFGCEKEGDVCFGVYMMWNGGLRRFGRPVFFLRPVDVHLFSSEGHIGA